MLMLYTLQTVDSRQVLDTNGHRVRFDLYTHAVTATRQRGSLRVSKDGKIVPLDDVDIIVVGDGIDWDRTVDMLKVEKDPARESAAAFVNGHGVTMTLGPDGYKPPPGITSSGKLVKKRAEAPVLVASPPAAAIVDAKPIETPAEAKPEVARHRTTPRPTSGALSISCNACKQEPGCHCTTKDGKVTATHKARREAAAAAALATQTVGTEGGDR